jgi:prolyl-tRNA synthetase
MQHAYTTSWGVSTRLIGGMIMAHADDNGLRLPPRVAPQQIVIVPILRDEAENAKVLAYAQEVAAACRAQMYANLPVRVKVDGRDMPSADKRWQWVKKGVPLILEVGPRDVAEGKVALTRRTALEAKKEFIECAAFASSVPAMLAELHSTLYREAEAILQSRTRTDITTWVDLEKYFGESGEKSFTEGQGFVRAKWNRDEAAYTPKLKALGLTIRCIPLAQSGTAGKCILTNQSATEEIIIARAY